MTAPLGVIYLPPAGGKTTRLLRWLFAEPRDEFRVLVFHDKPTAELYSQSAPPEWRDRFTPVSDLHTRCFGLSEARATGRRRVVLGIDNLDLMLRQLFGYPVGVVTMTKPEPPISVSRPDPPNFPEDVQTINRWLSSRAVDTYELIAELRRWLDYFENPFGH